jgi:hypothetical protein
MVPLQDQAVVIRPRLGQVLSRFREAFGKKYRVPAQQSRTLWAIESCRTAALGGHADVCDSCGHERISYNSCRNRHCPRCQKLKREQWVEKLACALLPVRYFHIVFTLPSDLNRLSLVNQRVVYDLLFASASQTVLTLAREDKRLGVETGMVAMLHTWGQTLTEHPHVHTLVPAGGWSDWNGYWKNTGKKFFAHVKVLSRMFRGKFLSGLKKAYAAGELSFEGELKALKGKHSFNEFLSTLYGKEWVVYAKAPLKNASGIIRYLGNYTHRVAISDERITSMDSQKVCISYKDYRSQGARKTMELPGEEFIRRFLMHVLPPGYCRIRYYGLFAMRNRQGLLARCKKAMGVRDRKNRFEGMNWQQVLLAVTGVDVTLCPCCKKGAMVTRTLLPGLRSPPGSTITSVL